MSAQQFNGRSDFINNLKSDKCDDATNEKCFPKYSNKNTSSCCYPESYKNKHLITQNQNALQEQYGQNLYQRQQDQLKEYKKQRIQCCNLSDKDKKRYGILNSSYVKQDKFNLYSSRLYNIHNQNLRSSNDLTKRLVQQKMTKSDYIHNLKYNKTR